MLGHIQVTYKKRCFTRGSCNIIRQRSSQSLVRNKISPTQEPTETDAIFLLAILKQFPVLKECFVHKYQTEKKEDFRGYSSVPTLTMGRPLSVFVVALNEGSLLQGSKLTCGIMKYSIPITQFHCTMCAASVVSLLGVVYSAKISVLNVLYSVH